MKKTAILACLLVAMQNLYAQTSQPDSMQVHNLQEVVVQSIRATHTTPVAFTTISAEDIKKTNYGKDLPYLLTMVPSVLSTSDAGAGIGYTTMRIRGTDGTRINVTVNGIPINDAESHNVFWVNMPDLASSVKDMQIQRGAGTSTNGAGSFGASVNMQTGNPGLKPYAELNGTYGSYNTHKESIKIGTGLIKDHWIFDARLSNISTDGYIDRASVDLKSYYFQGGYYGKRTSVKLITFGGKEKTYHAWNYASKEEMEQYGRTYNSCGYMYTDDNGKDHYYDDQTDNYTQTHYNLLFNHNFSNKLNFNIGLHYTRGKGYYQEYKSDRYLPEYGLTPFSVDGTLIEESDLVRKKALDNWFAGGVFSLNYTSEKLALSVGGGWNKYSGDHFGNVLWIENYVGELDPTDNYYFNKGVKRDGNIYAKANYLIGGGVSVYADLQYRHINYTIKGENDKYDWTSATGGMQQLDINEVFNFFNPKVGAHWQINKSNNIYASVSVAHKEPTRNNYTDGKFFEHPKAERLLDYELGYNYMSEIFSAGANFYYMDYKDQLVLTGALNEIGEPMAENVPDSYRMGVELMASLKLGCGFSWDINATLSRNRVENFEEKLYENEDPSADTWVTQLGDTHIAFSPDFILNNAFSYNYKGFLAKLTSQYVSKQYMSNLDCSEHILDSYFVSNLDLSYTFKFNGVKSVTVGCTIYNLFNHEYENNGYAGSGFYYDGTQKVRYNYAGYSAQAGTNVLAHIQLSF